MTDFGWALGVLRAGGAVARAGWNGKGMWIALAASGGEWPWPAQLKGAASYNAVPSRSLPFIFMRTVQGDLVPWLASQTDILALDWQVVE